MLTSLPYHVNSVMSCFNVKIMIYNLKNDVILDSVLFIFFLQISFDKITCKSSHFYYLNILCWTCMIKLFLCKRLICWRFAIIRIIWILLLHTLQFSSTLYLSLDQQDNISWPVTASLRTGTSPWITDNVYNFKDF